MPIAVKVEQKVFRTQDKKKMYAPNWKADAKGNAPKGVHHAAGAETEVHPNLVDKFKSFGYTEEKPVAELPAK